MVIEGTVPAKAAELGAWGDLSLPSIADQFLTRPKALDVSFVLSDRETLLHHPLLCLSILSDRNLVSAAGRSVIFQRVVQLLDRPSGLLEIIRSCDQTGRAILCEGVLVKLSGSLLELLVHSL